MAEPGEIFAAIEKQPPLMRAQTKVAYIGQEVGWALTFEDGFEEQSGKARVLFRYQPHDIKYIAMSVPLSDYPWLRSMRRGEPVQVHGRIAAIGTMSIELKDASLLQLVEAAR